MAKKQWLVAGLVMSAGVAFLWMRSRRDDDDLEDWDDDEPFEEQAATATSAPSPAAQSPRPFASDKAPSAETPAPKQSEATETSTAASIQPEASREPRREIKGNVRGDELLYHLPGDPGYDETIEEVMFATVEEAEAAGFRPAIQGPEN